MAQSITNRIAQGKVVKAAPKGRVIRSAGRPIIPRNSPANTDLIMPVGSDAGATLKLYNVAFVGLACGLTLSIMGSLSANNYYGSSAKALFASVTRNLATLDTQVGPIIKKAHVDSPRQLRVAHAARRMSEQKGRFSDPLLEDLQLVTNPVQQINLASFSIPTGVMQADKAVAPKIEQRPKDVQPHGTRALVGRVHSIIKKYSPKHKSPGVLAHAIVSESAKQGVDPLFVAAVIKAESTFNDTARSNKGAQGLMQIMPATGAWLTAKHDLPRGKLTDPGHNLKLGVTYLKHLVESYKGDRMFALVAYNWGPGHVDSATGGKRRIPKECMTYALKILGDYKRWRAGVI
jgi:hypothetical protein